jgi:hypothetical protein
MPPNLGVFAPLFFKITFYGVFEFGGVSKCFVNYLAFSACHFWSDVFDYESAVVLAMKQGVEVPFFLFLGGVFFGSFAV